MPSRWRFAIRGAGLRRVVSVFARHACHEVVVSGRAAGRCERQQGERGPSCRLHVESLLPASPAGRGLASAAVGAIQLQQVEATRGRLAEQAGGQDQ